jgi:alanyl-tRNA synthetase
VTTERLYYADSYLRSFEARVIRTSDDARVVYLDRTAFYPSSGGQPFDTGTIAGIAVEDVVDEGDLLAHKLAKRIDAVEVECSIDWRRRFDHMQQHTGQHVLSAVFAELCGWQTVSFHMGESVSTIELATAAVEWKDIVAAEHRTAEIIGENRRVSISSEDAETVQGLRKETERTGPIRVVSIEGLDRSACGGTHVRSTGEIGCVLVRGTEKIRGHVRLEFVCGGRAVARARADYDSLTGIARSFSANVDETPALVQALIERVLEMDKANRKMSSEIAGVRGRALYDETNPNAEGFRIADKAASLNDDTRAEAQAFVSRPKSAYIAWQDSPASVLVACSADSGKHAGSAIKDVVTTRGGRGGGSAAMAQASVPAGVSLAEIVDNLKTYLTGV